MFSKLTSFLKRISYSPVESIVTGEYDPVVNPTSHVETVINEKDLVVNPTPHIEVVIVVDPVVDPAPQVKIVINEEVAAMELAADVDVVVVERKEGSLAVKLIFFGAPTYFFWRSGLLVCQFFMLVINARQNDSAHVHSFH